MKLSIAPSHFEMPLSLATCIIDATASMHGIIVATVTGWWVRFAIIDPQKVAIQPQHVLRIDCINALAGFIVLTLHAVWGTGIKRVNRPCGDLNEQAQQIELQTKCGGLEDVLRMKSASPRPHL